MGAVRLGQREGDLRGPGGQPPSLPSAPGCAAGASGACRCWPRATTIARAPWNPWTSFSSRGCRPPSGLVAGSMPIMSRP